MKRLVNYYHIVLNLHKITIAEEIVFANGIKTTGDPDVTTVAYTDAQLQGFAATVLGEMGSRASDPHPSLTATEQKDVNKLSRSIIAVKNDVEEAANDKAQGDRAVFDTIVRRTGFVPRVVSKTHQRVFESLASPVGSLHVRVPSEGKNITYVYEYGITMKVGAPPPSFEDPIPITTTELIIDKLPSGTIVAMRYAAVKNPRGKGHAVVSAPESAVSKVLVIPNINNKGKIVHSHGTDFLHFSDIIYIVVQ